MVENTEMNSKTDPVTKTETVAVDTAPNRKGISLGSVIITFTLLGLLALSGVGYFLWDQLRSQQEGLGGTVDKGDKRILELRKQINNTQAQLATIEKHLGNLTETQNNTDQQYERLLKEQSKLYEERLKSAYAQIDTKLSNIQRQLGKTRGDWLIADAEYLLSVANERLHLTQDIKTTIMALEAADHRLRESGDGGVFKVRAKIAEEINALKKVDNPDIVGLVNKLSILQKQARHLRLALPTINSEISPEHNHAAADDSQGHAHHHDDDTTSLIDKAVDRALTDLKGMVVIRKRDPNGITFIHPEEARIIREDLMMRLDMAKSALVRRNENEFIASLSGAKEWLALHFDNKTGEVKSVLKSIDALMQTHLNSQLPDISRSLKMLRDVTKFRLGSELRTRSENTNTAEQKAVQNNSHEMDAGQPETPEATQ